MQSQPCSSGSPSPSAPATLFEIARREMLRRGLLVEFTPEEMREVEGMTLPPVDGLRDLRHLPWCSIDNPESKDLDQLSVGERLADGKTRVCVAIADVDVLVENETPLDLHARHNTTTVYTPAHIFSMLPERLSTDLTSLNDQADRHALVVEMVVGEDGLVGRSDVYRAVVRNRARLNYGDVASFLDGHGACPGNGSLPDLPDQLRMQDEAARRLKATRHRLGALELETFRAEAVVRDGEVVGLEVSRKDRARELIEELMIAANGVTARFLHDRGLPSLRRIVRTPKRWDRLVDLAAEYGVKLPDEPDAGALEAFLHARKKEDPRGHADLSLRVVKMLGPGEYSVDRPGDPPTGHFALAVRDYAHSTAPNRRYPDLVTHRLIKAVLAGKTPSYGIEDLEALAAHCTERENDANRVERQVRKSAAAMLLVDRVGEVFEAIVTGVTGRGDVFCRVVDPPVDGKLVRGHDRLDVGDALRVKLLEVDVERGFIDFAQCHGRPANAR